MRVCALICFIIAKCSASLYISYVIWTYCTSCTSSLDLMCIGNYHFDPYVHLAIFGLITNPSLSLQTYCAGSSLQPYYASVRHHVTILCILLSLTIPTSLHILSMTVLRVAPAYRYNCVWQVGLRNAHKSRVHKQIALKEQKIAQRRCESQKNNSCQHQESNPGSSRIGLITC